MLLTPVLPQDLRTAASPTFGGLTLSGLSVAGFVKNSVAGLLSTSTLPVTVPDGGTGLSTLVAGYIPYGAGTSAFASSANFAYSAANGLVINPDLATHTGRFNINLTAGGGGLIQAIALKSGSTTTNDGTSIDFYNTTTGTVGARIGSIRNAAGSGSSDLVFHTMNSGLSLAERMRVTETGYLGVGTTDIIYPLELVGLKGIIRLGDGVVNSTAKAGRLCVRHYTNSEEPIYIFGALSDSAYSSVAFGGGNPDFNAVTRIDFFTAADTTTVTGTARISILSSGYVGISNTDPTVALDVTGAALISTTLGVTGLTTATGGIKIIDGANLEKTTSDLTITTAANKTVVLSQPVYKDINLAGVLLAKPTSSAPGVDTFRDSVGTDTLIETLAFAIGEKVHGGFELQHDYKEGTDLVFHVHWQGIAAPAGGTDNVQWRLTYIVARDGVTLAAATTIDSPDVAINTRYRCYRNDFGAITGTNFKIGDQFMFTLERVAAVSDDYAGDCLIETAGIHYQCDTIGSRTISAK